MLSRYLRCGERRACSPHCLGRSDQVTCKCASESLQWSFNLSLYTFPRLDIHAQKWPDQTPNLAIADGPHHNPQTGAAIDGETIATTAVRTGETMTVGALAGIAHDVILLAVRPGERVGEETETETETDAIENPGNDLQALQMSNAEDADTAAIDTAKSVIAIGMVTGRQDDTEARDDDLVPPSGHQAHGHWNDAVHFPRNRMPSQTR